MKLDLAVIGGTGVYDLGSLALAERHRLETPYGDPSDAIVTGRIGAHRVAFLARHGEDHRHAPHQVNYRANLHALHSLGARRVLAINAVGGITEAMAPARLVVPDQMIDYTHGRVTSFSDMPDTKVRHIDFSEPYGKALRADLIAAAARRQIPVVGYGVYGATQGPRLETRAEIARLRRDGCDLVGMTGMPEAALARELDLDYASLCLVANWAAGCGDQAEITLEEIYANIASATAQVAPLIESLLGSQDAR